MKKWINNISKRMWVRIILILILFAILAFGFAGEKVAVADGIGWDGQNYYYSMQNFVSAILNGGYDQYAIQRVMPWGIVDVICSPLGIKVTVSRAIVISIFFNVIAIVIAVMYFFRLSNLKQWKVQTEILGFAFVFYTYPILKLLGYYPVISDVFGLTIGLMLCYYFYAEKKWALILLGFAGAFIWPTTPICAFALAFFPCKAIPSLSSISKTKENNILHILFVGLSSLPLMFMMVKMLRHMDQGMGVFDSICPMTVPVSPWIIPLTCLCSCLYLYYIVSAFEISLSSTIKENFMGKQVWYNYFGFILCTILSSIMCRLLANSETGALTIKSTLYVISFTSMTDPFVFIESHFIFYGLGYLLILFFWKDIAKIVLRQGMGYLFIIAIWALFSIRPEARVSIMYVVFPIMVLLEVLNTKSIRRYVVVLAALFSIFFSRFWYPFNVPNIEYYFAEYSEKFLEFPAQRYFMSSGHWQSHEMYYLFMTITILVGLIVYTGIKHKWFVRENFLTENCK